MIKIIEPNETFEYTPLNIAIVQVQNIDTQLHFGTTPNSQDVSLTTQELMKIDKKFYFYNKTLKDITLAIEEV